MFQNKQINSEQLGAEVGARAEELFQEGYNCCESMLKSATEVFQLQLPEDIYLMGKFFREGIAGTGCVCGALAGGIMVLGYLTGKDEGAVKNAEVFKANFIKEFGSSCCRVLRKKQSITERFTRKQCREITKYSATVLGEIINERGKE